MESLDYKSNIMVRERSFDDCFWGETIGFASSATEDMTLRTGGAIKASFVKKASWSPGRHRSFGPADDT